MDSRLITRGNKKTWRLILSEEADPYSNMAMDEALLEGYLELGLGPVLRIYGWKPVSFSFGYFQDPLVNFNIKECELRGMKFVRRITGGGVLYHHDDISYSIIASPEDFGSAVSVVESFKRTCAFLINMYKKMGIDAGFACDRKDYEKRYIRPSLADPNLCMASHEKYDIVSGDRKLGGNAQKRRRGAVMQHGSIPLNDTLSHSKPFLKFSAMAADMNVTSLGQALGQHIRYDEIERLLEASFRQTFGFDMTRTHLTAGELEIFEDLVDNKYSTEGWNFERSERCKKAVLA
jgi:lipoyl(octanoyl) transferase